MAELVDVAPKLEDFFPLDVDELETLMPCDLVRADVLKLERARTQADFEAALRTKGRLGAWLR